MQVCVLLWASLYHRIQLIFVTCIRNYGDPAEEQLDQHLDGRTMSALGGRRVYFSSSCGAVLGVLWTSV